MTEKKSKVTVDIEAIFPNLAKWVKVGLDRYWRPGLAGVCCQGFNEGDCATRRRDAEPCRGDDGVGEGLGEVARRERLMATEIVPPKQKTLTLGPGLG